MRNFVLPTVGMLMCVACNLAPSSSKVHSGVDNSTVRSEVLAQAPTEEDRVVVNSFFDLSNLPRPSGGEGPSREYLIDIANNVNARIGRTVVRHEVDRKGNVLFTLEGTGKYAGNTQPVVTLQSHLDMIWAVSNVAGGSDLSSFFNNGVALALEDGWLKSATTVIDGVSHTTTIGADDGSGVAIMARYMIEFEKEHPAMELLFTVAEETSLAGVDNLELELTAPNLISLDAVFANRFIHGCPGNVRGRIQAAFSAAVVPAGSALLTIQVRGLRGGHSGNDVHKPRLNSAMLGMAITRAIVEGGLGDVRLVAVDAGARLGEGAIPTSADVVLAVPQRAVAAAKQVAQSVFAAAVAGAADEIADASHARLNFVEASAADVAALDADGTRRFYSSVLALKNGPISYSPDTPTGVNSSSNIGYLTLSKASDDSMKAYGGYMVRSYSPAEQDSIREFNKNALVSWDLSGDSLTIEYTKARTPFASDLDGPFYSLVRSVLPHFTLSLTGGTNELAVLSERLPNVGMTAVGPDILDAHSPSERMSLESFFSTNAAIIKLVEAFGNAN